MKRGGGFSPESDPSIAGHRLSSAFHLHAVKEDPVLREGHRDMAVVKSLPVSRPLRDIELRRAGKVVCIAGKFKESVRLHIQWKPPVKYGHNVLWRALLDLCLEVKGGILKARREEVYIPCNAIEGCAAPERNGPEREGVFRELQISADGVKCDVINNPPGEQDCSADDRFVHGARYFSGEGCGAVQGKARDFDVTGNVCQLSVYTETDIAPLPDLPGEGKALDFIFIIQPPLSL